MIRPGDWKAYGAIVGHHAALDIRELTARLARFSCQREGDNCVRAVENGIGGRVMDGDVLIIIIQRTPSAATDRKGNGNNGTQVKNS